MSAPTIAPSPMLIGLRIVAPQPTATPRPSAGTVSMPLRPPMVTPCPIWHPGPITARGRIDVQGVVWELGILTDAGSIGNVAGEQHAHGAAGARRWRESHREAGYET